jgi:DNA-binding PucR family transcriptional regulator
VSRASCTVWQACAVHAAQWDPPSPAVAELIREGARRLLEARDAVFAAVDAATRASLDEALLADPVLVEAYSRSTRRNLERWAEHNVAAPGTPVPVDVAPENLAIGRDLLRRGLDAGALDSYRTGQNAAWRMWMAMAFQLTSDPAQLAELLDVTARSIFAYVDGSIAAIAEQLEAERERLTRGSHAERLEVVTLLLEGAPISADRAAARLQYALDRDHTAAVVVAEDPAALEATAEALARAAGARRPLVVPATATSSWVWVHGTPALGEGALPPGVRVALGTTGRGVEGFRRSHLDALAAQRLAHRAEVRLARFEDLEVVALATADEERARQFADRTLGDLRTGPPELRETLRVWLAEGSNASRTAERLPAHRNTVLARLARAEELLPAPVEGRRLQVALALEVERWL